MDLLDFIRGRYRRGKLYRLLSQLPRSSRFRQAQANDEEYAELLLSKFAGTPAPKGPPLGEYTLEAELLTGIGEQLERVVQRLAWLGQDKYRLSPWPRPETAVDRLKARIAMERIDSLIDEVREAQERWSQNRDLGAPGG